jgi:5-formyltetrahydrofolate cyclo-ligase
MILLEKKRIRQIFLAKRNELSAKDVAEKSEKIGKKILESLEFYKFKSVMFYASTTKEVSTHALIYKALDRNKRVFLPIVESEENLAVSEILNPDEELEANKWGILEPKKEFRRPCNIKDIEVVYVPGIVFDCEGGRIGYGRGFYDRFFKSVSSNALKIGLCFDFQVMKQKLPLKEHDVRMNMLVTEKKCINCQ